MQQWIKTHSDGIDEALSPKVLQEPMGRVGARNRREHEERMIVYTQCISIEDKRRERYEPFLIDRDSGKRWVSVGIERGCRGAPRDSSKPLTLDRASHITADHIKARSKLWILGAEEHFRLRLCITIHAHNVRRCNRLDG
jgi:hypothetical protein